MQNQTNIVTELTLALCEYESASIDLLKNNNIIPAEVRVFLKHIVLIAENAAKERLRKAVWEDGKIIEIADSLDRTNKVEYIGDRVRMVTTLPTEAGECVMEKVSIYDMQGLLHKSTVELKDSREDVTSMYGNDFGPFPLREIRYSDGLVSSDRRYSVSPVCKDQDRNIYVLEKNGSTATNYVIENGLQIEESSTADENDRFTFEYDDNQNPIIVDGPLTRIEMEYDSLGNPVKQIFKKKDVLDLDKPQEEINFIGEPEITIYKNDYQNGKLRMIAMDIQDKEMIILSTGRFWTAI